MAAAPGDNAVQNNGCNSLSYDGPPSQAAIAAIEAAL
jgi:hypothetical protein